jgi:SAM-dependent methyltransferase
MLSEEEGIGPQAERHELVSAGSFASVEEYSLFLIHKKAYEEAAELARGLRVLDLGCNTGYGTHIIAQSARSVIGVDVSPRAIAEAKRLYPGLDLQLVDGRSLPFPDRSFDMVVGFQVIGHVAEPDRYLHEIKRVLVNDGVLLLTTPNAALGLPADMRPRNPLHLREYRAGELQELLQRHFSATQIMGLFAEEPLHSIEVDRIRRRIKKAGRRQSVWHRFKTKLKRRFGLANKTDKPKETRRTRKRKSPLSEDVLQQYTTAAYSYRADNLDQALDLLAICKQNS